MSQKYYGLELSSRQVEGKHRTYVQVARKAKKTKCMDVNIPYGEPCRPRGAEYIYKQKIWETITEHLKE